ncbi:MAG: AAA family ATPase, partial [Rikenellaceae bacterium]
GESGDGNTWLADEEEINGEKPMWFSEDSHTLSPLYLVTEYTKALNMQLELYYQPIVVMMHPHYVINIEDIVKVWDDTPVVSIKRLCKFIESRGDLESLNTKIDDLCRDPNRGRSSANNDSDDITISKVRFAIGQRGDDHKESSIATHFRVGPYSVLSLWIDVVGSSILPSNYRCELRSSNEVMISQDISSLCPDQTTQIDLELPSLGSGNYWVYIKNGDKELYSQKLTLFASDEGHEKYISCEGFGLYRINECDNPYDHNTITLRGGQSCFRCEELGGILVVAIFKNISGAKLPYQLILKVTNNSDEQLYEERWSEMLDPQENYVFTETLMGSLCERGDYTLQIDFLGESVAEYNFIVGERDVKTTFRANQLQPRTKTKQAVKSTMRDPMRELEAMIGLDSIKKQLRKQIAKIQLDKVRKDRGLPIKAQQLHMAFLGSAGTGKTTVAKLLGKIYREIGALSKGHVVVEDRSTLMNQNWGAEGELVNKALEKAQGGILFIDEAYDLVTEHKSDPGKLIISALLQAMADERNRDFMVIFAGYSMPMERLLSKNQGLRSRLTSVYFDDYKVPELMKIADLWLKKNCYTPTPDARRYLESIINSAYAVRDENFGNARYVVNLLENEVQPAMAERVMKEELFMAPHTLLTTIEACDIPNYNAERGGATEAIARLDKMVGLSELKGQIRSHLSYIRFVQARRENKIETPIPPLHMLFTGNPGTGKSSVAEYLGDIYRSMGILSVGNVIKVTRADMIDSAVGGTEEKMKELITAAHGNILFIDEAYTLFSKNENDVGKNAVEVLLDALGKESVDMIVILAGYPKEMEELLSVNTGLRGRFPYTFNFEDYDEDELFEIAESVVKRNSLKLTEGAAKALRALIRKECKIKDSSFSNARFVVRLITTQVLPNMALRLEGERDREKLKRVLQRDIPIEHKQIRMINENLFDEEMIEAALEQLDSMVGLTKVKVAVHQFVDFARNINRKDPTQIERYPLKWSFVGNTGTGKSSVAELLSQILKAMHLLGKGHTVEVKAEELYGVATYKADELLQQRMRESLQGLLFVDGDAPQFRASDSSFNPDYLRMCLAVNTAEIHGRFAVVIAEQDSPKVALAKSLNKIGVSNFDHTLIFDDYTAEELMAILTSQLSRHDLTLSIGAATTMYSYIQNLSANNGATDANARTMKELARAIRNIASASDCDTKEISANMVEKFSSLQSPRTRIGY